MVVGWRVGGLLILCSTCGGNNMGGGGLGPRKPCSAFGALFLDTTWSPQDGELLQKSSLPLRRGTAPCCCSP